jgi:hypothetical protein
LGLVRAVRRVRPRSPGRTPGVVAVAAVACADKESRIGLDNGRRLNLECRRYGVARRRCRRLDMRALRVRLFRRDRRGCIGAAVRQASAIAIAPTATKIAQNVTRCLRRSTAPVSFIASLHMRESPHARSTYPTRSRASYASRHRPPTTGSGNGQTRFDGTSWQRLESLRALDPQCRGWRDREARRTRKQELEHRQQSSAPFAASHGR